MWLIKMDHPRLNLVVSLVPAMPDVVSLLEGINRALTLVWKMPPRRPPPDRILSIKMTKTLCLITRQSLLLCYSLKGQK